jgi:hypothetical protein
MLYRTFEKIRWTYFTDKDSEVLNLDYKDLNIEERIYNKYHIEPESAAVVSIELILQHENLTRYAIKELDILLKVGGTFQVVLVDNSAHSSYLLSRDQVKYEFAVATNGRYILTAIEENAPFITLNYRKNKATLPEDDFVECWTFGIITNGKKLDSLNELIASIHELNIPNYEIIICGPYPQEQSIDYKYVSILEDVTLESDIRFPVSTKKNKIIHAAKYNNLCVVHDRFHFPTTWFTQMKAYGNFFDYLCLPTVDNAGNRFQVDWMKFCYPLTKRLNRNPSLKYSQWHPDVIIQGGIITGKKHLIKKYCLDERLHWGEMEDIQFSKQAYLDGCLFYIDSQNHVISKSVNHKPVNNYSVLSWVKTTLMWYLHIVKLYFVYNRLIRRNHKKNKHV